MRVVWVDLLCLESVIKLFLSRHSIERVYYINALKFIEPFLPWIERQLKCTLVRLDMIVEGEAKLRDVSLYESIHSQMSDVLETWASDENFAQWQNNVCVQHGLNADKFKAHLMEAAYPQVYRPMEMLVLAEHLSPRSPNFFLLRKTPFTDLFRIILGEERVRFYRSFLMPLSFAVPRPGYYYDRHFKRELTSGRSAVVARFVGKWLMNVLGGLVSIVHRRPAVHEVNVGVELVQGPIRSDQMNDIAWIQGSGIDPKNICGLQRNDLDEESGRILKSVGIARYKIAHSPWVWVAKLFNAAEDKNYSIVTAGWTYGLATAVMVLSIFRSVFFWNSFGWIEFQAVRYRCRVLFWRSIYAQLGIKITWSLRDIDEDKLAKSQAVELLGGFSTGAHGNNLPVYRIDNAKCTDVLFAWGEHFIKNNFNRYPFAAIFLTGYPFDYYFESRRKKAKEIRDRYDKKFIIAYQDNIAANDLPYSKAMQLEVHRILLSILRKFDKVIVFLKPERGLLLDEMLAELPEFKTLIHEGRVVVFSGRDERSTEIAMASDLVVGLGIGTPAAEAYFAGTVAFHADLTGFPYNDFANRGLGAVVFRDIFTLENAMIERVTGKNKWKTEEYRGYYMSLDPFQDGWASRRIGFIIKRMREYLGQGCGRDQVLHKVAKDYDVYLSSMPNLQSLSLN